VEVGLFQVTDNFELVPGGIEVRDADGRFTKVATPKGFTDFSFRNAVAAYDTVYRTNGTSPTVAEVRNCWPNLSAKDYSKLFLTDEFKEALEYRGISWDPDSGLSLEQSMVLLALTDPTDGRSTGAKLRDFKVSPARYDAWMRNPLFLQSYKNRQEYSLATSVPMVLGKLVSNAERGDQRAMEKILEITGRWNPAERQIEDAKAVIMAVMESVTRNVASKSEREAILGDIQAQIVGFNVTHNNPEIES
jgi:hypothetical protein